MSQRIEDGGAALLPCPFCGEPSIGLDREGADYLFYCEGCGATVFGETQANARAAWNRRAAARQMGAQTGGEA